MTITLGTTVQVDASGSVDNVAFGKIDDDTVAVFYNDTNTQLSGRILNITRATRTIDTVGAQQDLRNQGYHFGGLNVVELSTSKWLFWGCGQLATGSTLAVINESSGTLSYALSGELTPTDAIDMTDARNVFDMVKLTSSKALICYPYTESPEFDTRARIINIDGSDNVTEASAAIVTDDFSDRFALAVLSSTKVLLVYIDDSDTSKLKGRVLTISGDTITPGAITTIDTNVWATIDLVAADSTRCIVVGRYSTNSERGYILTVSGTTFSAGAANDLDLGDTSADDFIRATMPNVDTLIVGYDGLTVYEVYEVNVNLAGDALTVTNSDSTTTNFPLNANAAIFSFHSNHIIAGSFQSLDATVGSTAEAVAATAGKLDMATIPKPVDINIAGNYVYIAALNSLGYPTLLKMATSLDVDATVVFNPGNGSDIGVQCGRFDADVIWVAGDFGGTDVVEKSEDAGSNFAVKDPGTFGTVEAFVVGPDSDDRILISDVTNDDLQETIDNGTTWTAINTALGFNTNAIARLAENVQETVFGNDSGATNQVDYSVNTGADTEDITSGMDQADVTSLAIG